jgi:hypothetical protein
MLCAQLLLPDPQIWECKQKSSGSSHTVEFKKVGDMSMQKASMCANMLQCERDVLFLHPDTWWQALLASGKDTCEKQVCFIHAFSPFYLLVLSSVSHVIADYAARCRF